MGVTQSIQEFLAVHHLKLIATLAVTYLLPAGLHFAVRKANLIAPGSPWDIRLHKVMKFTFDTTRYEDVEAKIEEVAKDVVDGVVETPPPDAANAPGSVVVLDPKEPGSDKKA